MVSVVSSGGWSRKSLVRSGLETRTRPEGNHLPRGPLRISPLFIACLTRERIAARAKPRKFRTSSGLSLAKLAAVVEPVEGDFSVLADLDEVAVGITHVAAPFPAVIV